MKLKLELPLKSAAPRGVVPRVKRSGMQALAVELVTDSKALPLYAKPRVEATTRKSTPNEAK